MQMSFRFYEYLTYPTCRVCEWSRGPGGICQPCWLAEFASIDEDCERFAYPREITT